MKRTPLQRKHGLRKPQASEKEIQKSILDWLRWKGYVAVKFHSSIMVGGGENARFIKSPQRGVSDILACSPAGRFVAIEVKRDGGHLADEQKEFLASIDNRRGIAIVAHCIDDVEFALRAELESHKGA